MISKKLSFDLDQAECCSFIRLNVTDKNVKRCQVGLSRKKIRLFIDLRAHFLEALHDCVKDNLVQFFFIIPPPKPALT